MDAFKCNEAANERLIRLFVLGNGRLRCLRTIMMHRIALNEFILYVYVFIERRKLNNKTKPEL